EDRGCGGERTMPVTDYDAGRMHKHSDCNNRCLYEDQDGYERCTYDPSYGVRLRPAPVTFHGSGRSLHTDDDPFGPMLDDGPDDSEPPLVAGGQGRSGAELHREACSLLWLLLSLLVVAVFCAGWALQMGWITTR